MCIYCCFIDVLLDGDSAHLLGYKLICICIPWAGESHNLPVMYSYKTTYNQIKDISHLNVTTVNTRVYEFMKVFVNDMTISWRKSLDTPCK